MQVLVTGATGFVGNPLCKTLIRHGHRVRAAIRGPSAAIGHSMQSVMVGDLGPETIWSDALRDIQVIVHLAARVHVMREHAPDPLAEFRRVNVEGTRQLAKQAVEAGVRRLVYVSTIKVSGERTDGRGAFTPNEAPQPEDAYAQSKHEAELLLRDIANKTGLDVVIVRPPLVYGPGVKGNFFSLLRWIDRGWPLPLASCHNRRSLVGITNFTDLLARCVEHPGAAGRTLLAGDGEDLSTSELIRRLARALNRPARLLSVPRFLLRVTARALGRPGVYERLCGSLQVDISDARKILDWTPPATVDDELVRTANWFRQYKDLS